MARPSPFFIFLLLIVKSGMYAVSFAAKHAMRPSCLSCADGLLLLLTGLLEDVYGLMTVFLVFDTRTLFGGSFSFLSSRGTFLSSYIATSSSIGAFLGCCLIALSNCRAASRILLAGVKWGGCNGMIFESYRV